MEVSRAAGARSAASALSVAKQEHAQSDHARTDALALAQREANRAATCGLEPPKRAAPFPLESARSSR
eukprot:5376590-Alexandrium_andersonii.AAC.1